MALSSEDRLRLNVLLAGAEAVRIDEAAMTVYGLQGECELKVSLHPDGAASPYLRQVRELLSGAVLGSGYPAFLRPWTRLGWPGHEALDKLLILGEPEAVVAVARSPHLTDALARRAWWAAPHSETARHLLEHPAVAGGALGPRLAECLLAQLPFETDEEAVLASVRLVLQPGLISEAARRRLWLSGRTRESYHVGFLASRSDDLPDPVAPRADLQRHEAALAPLAAANPYARLLWKLLDSRGQTFIAVAADTLQCPADRQVASALLNAIGGYFGELRRTPEELREVRAIEARVEALCAGGDPRLRELLDAAAALAGEIRAMLFLAHLDEAVLTPIFAATDAVGAVMRKRIQPVVGPILQRLALLRGQG